MSEQTSSPHSVVQVGREAPVRMGVVTPHLPPGFPAVCVTLDLPRLRAESRPAPLETRR